MADLYVDISNCKCGGAWEINRDPEGGGMYIQCCRCGKKSRARCPIHRDRDDREWVANREDVRKMVISWNAENEESTQKRREKKMPEKWVGMRVKDLIEIHNVQRPGGFQVYRLQYPEDKTGRLITEDITLASACERVPSIADARIVYAEDLYGTIVLRIRSVIK